MASRTLVTRSRRVIAVKALTTVGLAVLIILCCLDWSPVHAQGQAADQTYYSKQLGFRIPFHVDAAEQRIKEVQLHVSEDLGKTWGLVAKAQPSDRFFNFQSRR